MKKFVLTILLTLTIWSNAWAATYYFSSSTGDNNTGDGSISKPWYGLYPNKSATNAISPDDILLYKAGDQWFGAAAYQIFDSSGTAGHPITVDRYGSGADPFFTTAAVTTGFSYTGANNIYSKSGQFVSIYTVGVDGTSALGYWNGSNTTLPPGSFTEISGTLYIRLADNSNPSGHTIYVPTAYQYNEYRGVVEGSPAKGSYLNINHMQVAYSNGVGISLSQPHSSINNCTATGNGREGISLVGYNPGSEMASYCTVKGNTATYNNARGNGYGQAITVGSDHSWVISNIVHNNFKEGIDFLDYSSDTNVNFGGVIYNTVYQNNQDPSATFGGAGIYIDGARDILVFGNDSHGSGTGNDVQNSVAISISSEHQTKPVYNITVANNLMYDCSYYCLSLGGGGDYPNYNNGTPSVGNTIVNNTIIRGSSGYGGDIGFANLGTSPKNIFKNNVIIKAAGGYPAIMWDGGITSSTFDMDYNIYYDPNKSVIFSTGDGSGGYTNQTLAQWQGTSGLDAHSLQLNPYIISTTFASIDAHLQRVSLGQANTSPAIAVGLTTPYTPAAYIATAAVLANNGAVVGTTRSDGISTAASDMGYHYYVPTPNGNLTADSIVPGNLYMSQTSSIVASFTVANDWPLDGTLIVTFPSSLGGGFKYNDPSTTTASFTSGGSGSLAVGIVGNVMTLTRSGGSTVTASSAVQITITNVRNPNAAGSTGAYQMQTTNSAGTFIDTDTNISGNTITASALTSTSVIPVSLVAGTTNNVNASFTLGTAWPSTGKVLITFPTALAGGFTFNSTGSTAASFTAGGDGSLAVSISSNVVTLTRSGGTQKNAATACTIQLTNILNPSSGGSTGTFNIQTTDASNNVIDQNLAVAADTITFVAPNTNNSFAGPYTIGGVFTITRQ